MAAGGARKPGARKEEGEPWGGWGKAAPNTNWDSRTRKGKRLVHIGQRVTCGGKKNKITLTFIFTV